VPNIESSHDMKRFATLLVLTAALTGCTSGITKPAEPPLGPLARVTSAHDIRLPLQGYELTPPQAETLHQARLTLNRICASRFGAPYTDTTPPTLSVSIDIASRRYGIIEASHASRYGYHTPTNSRSHAADTEGAGHLGWRPGRLELSVLTGRASNGKPLTPHERPTDEKGIPLASGGCLAETESQLNAGLSRVDPQFLPHLQGESFRLAESDSRLLTAWSTWSKCMLAHKHHYQSPWQPNDEATGENISATEKKTATDDVACRVRTRMTDTWMAVESAYQTRMLSEHKKGLTALADYQAALLDRAEAIVAH
jgi:hypothetical protein